VISLVLASPALGGKSRFSPTRSTAGLGSHVVRREFGLPEP